ncbi:DegV family protein [Vagococcus vulneris]|uniref:Fatty acid-binding protein DegV n=1 Tax=Vagococcus vulneris TaxID=1977869 RepID=A0A430A2N6_9ENTE|nr:DegV family protein [Vagococcus vulneris]RSU00704.1 fatty acid-binding protein DegV [Vagococcus vulneris]
MKTAIVTDSTVFLTDKYREKDNIFILPVPLILDNQVYHETIDIHPDKFYDLLRESESLPKTSQPAFGEAVKLYETIAEQGFDAIISIHLSGGISGFVNTVHIIAQEVPQINIFPFDSKITSGPMGKLVEIASDLADKELSAKEIVDILSDVREKVEGYIVVDDLNHLVRSGRLKNGAAIIGTLFKIKPILSFQSGDIVLTEKVRSQKKALHRVEDIVLNEITSKMDASTFYVIHCNNLEVAEQVKQELLTVNNLLDVQICDFGPVIATHLGEKSVAIGVAPKTVRDLM